MYVAMANFTAPAMCHVVCTVVATGITGINVTTSVPAVDQTPPQHRTVPLPKGYVAYPDIGFAYKVHDAYATFKEARRRCVAEGGELALIDSTKKLEYVKRQEKSSTFAHVGIIRMYDNETWVGVATGLPVTSLPWNHGDYSRENEDCVQIDFSDLGLFVYSCQSEENYICEIPVRVRNNTISGN